MEHEERLKAALADRYAIESEIGSGGMATVYLAQDLKHDRKVAVKVLKPELAAVVGTERFLAEIRTTANLSHPHILPLHDSGEADAFLFYVMPYVEGESLRERLDRDGQLSVEEAVRIAGHVADALDYAHQQGVIHRDIKPGNILFQAGDPVVTDFGIALAISAAGEGRLTETGLSLGTPYYMSPEQAAGDQKPTAASDVYSLGCVLYEMLTGEPPHTGASAQAILGKILLADVTRPTKLRRTIPANVEGAVLKALERLPADRFETASELTAALKDKAFRHGLGIGAAASAGPWKGLAIGFGGLAALAVALGYLGVLTPKPPPPETQRLQIHPPGWGFQSQWARYFALAPDGSSMVYNDSVGMESGHQLWVKDREVGEGRPLSGTNNARDVVYSPDGQWLLYAVGTELVKRPIQGAGTQTILQDVGSSWTALDWMANGRILCEQRGEEIVLVRFPGDTSAAPDTVVVLPDHPPTWARGLPGGEAALVVRCVGTNCADGTYLSVVDFQRNSVRTLQDEVLKAWYVPTGHVVWVRRDGAVFATPFDVDRLDFSGAPIPLFEGVHTTTAVANMVMGKDGTVVYMEGVPTSAAGRQVVWVDRAGRHEPVDPDWEPDQFGSLSLSPDGGFLAIDINSSSGRQIWRKELPDGALTPLTTGEHVSFRPVWSPDGSMIAYSNTEGDYHIRTLPSDGSSVGAFTTLLKLERIVPQAVYTPDGRGLVYRIGGSAGTADIGYLDLTTGERDDSLHATEFVELAVALSPDGNWLAYVSNRSGDREVYVRRFPDMSGFQLVSRDGGTEPVWSRDREKPELFYRGRDGYMMAVTYSADSLFTVEDQVRLFDARQFRSAPTAVSYDYSPSEGRFIMVLLDALGGRIDVGPAPRLIMIQNFFTEVEERIGEGG